jgi:hypothetical protein
MEEFGRKTDELLNFLSNMSGKSDNLIKREMKSVKGDIKLTGKEMSISQARFMGGSETD